MEKLDINNGSFFSVAQAKTFIEKRLHDEIDYDNPQNADGSNKVRTPQGLVCGLLREECRQDNHDRRVYFYNQSQKFSLTKNENDIAKDDVGYEVFSNPLIGTIHYARADEYLPRSVVTIIKRIAIPNQCHYNSVMFAKETPDSECDVVCGIIDPHQWQGQSSGVLHSWIENKNDQVIDITQNIVMPKADYYKFFQAIAITKIDSNTIKSDFADPITKKQISSVDPRIYLLARVNLLDDVEPQR